MSSEGVTKPTSAVVITDPTESETVQVFKLHFDGKIEADWNRVYQAKERYIRDESRDSADCLLAAIWFAKNT